MTQSIKQSDAFVSTFFSISGGNNAGVSRRKEQHYKLTSFCLQDGVEERHALQCATKLMASRTRWNSASWWRWKRGKACFQFSDLPAPQKSYGHFSPTSRRRKKCLKTILRSIQSCRNDLFLLFVKRVGPWVVRIRGISTITWWKLFHTDHQISYNYGPLDQKKIYHWNRQVSIKISNCRDLQSLIVKPYNSKMYIFGFSFFMIYNLTKQVRHEKTECGR